MAHMTISLPDDELVRRIASRDNLAWSWRKLRANLNHSELWCNEWEVARFEANLDQELKQLAEEIENGTYVQEPMRPFGQPKKAATGEVPVRQLFWVPIQNQLAWLSVINVIGRYFEAEMPIWSYANRLHRSVWYDDSFSLQVGPHRSTSSLLYRPFRQSWPLYRRHIALTVRAMGRLKERPEDPADDHTLKLEESRVLADPERLPYLFEDFWGNAPSTVYRAHIDLRKFYPSVNLECVYRNFLDSLPGMPRLHLLLSQLLKFRVTFEGVPSDAIDYLGLRTCLNAKGDFSGIPTGLFAGGFIANVAMLRLDRQVAARLPEVRVAHFRYVDDHTFLAPSATQLMGWISEYLGLVASSGLGIEVHPSKSDPPVINAVVDQANKDSVAPSQFEATLEKIEQQCKVDPTYPAPLMTATLTKMSEVARTPFSLLNIDSQDRLLEECRFLLTARLPDDEIRDDTRMSFAAGVLSSLGPKRIASGDNHARQTRSRFLQLFVRTIHAYPEKLRLWSRALNFCRASGCDDLSPLVSQFTLQAQALGNAAPFLAACLYRHIHRQIVQCLKCIGNSDELEDVRDRCLDYLKSILAIELPATTGDSWWFWPLLQAERMVAKAAARAELASCASGERPGLSRDLQKKCEEIASSLDTDSVPFCGSRESMPVWIYLWDRLLTGTVDNRESALWRAHVSQFDLKSNQDSIVFATHPSSIPPELADMVLRSPGDLAERLRDESWQFEVAWFSQPKERTDRLRGTRWQFMSKKSSYCLLHWVEWLKEQWERRPYDPRVSEWTTLEVFRKLTDRADVIGTSGEYLHPANILIPRRWTEGDVPRSWEAWRHALDPQNGLKLRAKDAVRDSATEYMFRDAGPESASACQVFAMGKLILGTLRRSFFWPSRWVTAGQGASELPGVSLEISRLNVSSWTAAILESCLLPRGRETAWLGLWSIHANDTTRDPPVIGDLKTLNRYLQKALDVLRKFQLTVPEGTPRQLVPRRLDQRIGWDDANAEISSTDEE